MGMFGNLIGSAVAGTTTLVGNALATYQANKGWREALGIADERLKDIRQRKIEAREHRDKEYYQDPTQTAENQAAVTQGQTILDEGAKRAQATKDVAGGTEESVALQKAANAQAVANMIQQQAVEGANKKERAWENGEAQLNGLNNEEDVWQRYKADTAKAKYLSRAQNITNTANAHAASHVEFGNALPW